MEQRNLAKNLSTLRRAAALAEGDSLNREEITYLAPLPVFNADGTVKE